MTSKKKCSERQKGKKMMLTEENYFDEHMDNYDEDVDEDYDCKQRGR